MSIAIIATLLTRMVRIGALDADDIEAMATDLEGEGEHEGATLLRGAFCEGQAPEPSQWSADRARARFRLVSDGGNSTD